MKIRWTIWIETSNINYDFTSNHMASSHLWGVAAATDADSAENSNNYDDVVMVRHYDIDSSACRQQPLCGSHKPTTTIIQTPVVVFGVHGGMMIIIPNASHHAAKQSLWSQP
jgi:hypothetical protein